MCELAQAIYQATLNPDFFFVETVDIAQSDALIESYGTRIPVLKRTEDNSELNWPFDAQQLMAFLS